MNTNIRNAIMKMNTATGYAMELEVSNGRFQAWEQTQSDPHVCYAKIYNTEGFLEVEFLERDGGVIASVMNRFNKTTARVTRIMDTLMEFMPIAPPGGD